MPSRMAWTSASLCLLEVMKLRVVVGGMVGCDVVGLGWGIQFCLV